MKISEAEYRRRNWYATQLAHDFQLWDVWAVPLDAKGGARNTFDDFLTFFEEMGPELESSRTPTGLLFRLRAVLGRFAGWDEHVNVLPIPGSSDTSLSDRMAPEERKHLRVVPAADYAAFVQVYKRESDALYEISNDTCHAALHLAWVPGEQRGWDAQIAVYVLPRGLKGRLYLALILPFRHLVVYPAMLRAIQQGWNKRR
ncbi:MAG: DUF2867 domain-containing protein [Myxococcales bacterium]|nr:DUF2867 domain-containing protein [Myxococcales bacterium]